MGDGPRAELAYRWRQREEDRSVRVSGTQRVAAPRDAVWAALNDQEVLARCTPGCKRLVKTAEDRYEAELELGIAAIRGQYRGSLSITDKEPPHRYRLDIAGEGGAGFVKASLALQLEPQGEATVLNYEGEAQVGGPIASIGQRVLGGVARMIMGQFFGNLAREMERRQREGA